MSGAHIFLVILATVVLIIFAEYQKLRNISWILSIGCVTYILLIITPENTDPIFYNNTDLNRIDSSSINKIAYNPVETAPSVKVNLPEHENTNKINSDTFSIRTKMQNLNILTLNIATDIVDKSPIGICRLFLNDIDALYCFTVVDNTLRNNTIIHTWKHNGQDYYKNFITVGDSPNWRCWSRITIRPEMTGDWNVTVTDTVGNYLDSIDFSIIPTSE